MSPGGVGLAPALPPRWRSVLFVPADRPDLAAKAPRAEPDLVVLDLEDAVPPAGKVAARAQLGDLVGTVAPIVPVAVRVNAPGTPWFSDDVAAVPDRVSAVVVPKLETPAQVASLATVLRSHGVVAGIETVLGVVDARQVLVPPVVACYFGAEDYVTDLGGRRTDGNAEVAWARAWVAVAARLARVRALDMVTVRFGDSARFQGEAESARALGYAGKLCIHPAQVPLANQAFQPSESEVRWARTVMDAFTASGGTTIAVHGEMVDEVVAARARAVLSDVVPPAPGTAP